MASPRNYQNRQALKNDEEIVIDVGLPIEAIKRSIRNGASSTAPGFNFKVLLSFFFWRVMRRRV